MITLSKYIQIIEAYKQECSVHALALEDIKQHNIFLVDLLGLLQTKILDLEAENAILRVCKDYDMT